MSPVELCFDLFQRNISRNRDSLHRLDSKLTRRKAIMTVYENEGAKPAMEFKKELDKGNIPQARRDPGKP